MATTLVNAAQITDDLIKQLNSQNENQVQEEEVLEGTVVEDVPPSKPLESATSPIQNQSQEEELRSRIQSGEWDNLDALPAFKARTDEGQLMARTEAVDFRIRQLELRLPMLLNQHLHDAYIQVLKKIHALRKTKGTIFYMFYKNSGQRDLDAPK